MCIWHLHLTFTFNICIWHFQCFIFIYNYIFISIYILHTFTILFHLILFPKTVYFSVLGKLLGRGSVSAWSPIPSCRLTRLVRFSTTNRAFKVRAWSNWKRSFSLQRELNWHPTMKSSGESHQHILTLGFSLLSSNLILILHLPQTDTHPPPPVFSTTVHLCYLGPGTFDFKLKMSWLCYICQKTITITGYVVQSTLNNTFGSTSINFLFHFLDFV